MLRLLDDSFRIIDDSGEIRFRFTRQSNGCRQCENCDWLILGGRLRMKQRIRFCKSRDEVRIGFATAGEGSPLMRVNNWFTHLELDWDNPVWRHWSQTLGEPRMLVRYDPRGSGLSDRDVSVSDHQGWMGMVICNAFEVRCSGRGSKGAWGGTSEHGQVPEGERVRDRSGASKPTDGSKGSTATIRYLRPGWKPPRLVSGGGRLRDWRAIRLEVSDDQEQKYEFQDQSSNWPCAGRLNVYEVALLPSSDFSVPLPLGNYGPVCG